VILKKGLFCGIPPLGWGGVECSTREGGHVGVGFPNLKYSRGKVK